MSAETSKSILDISTVFTTYFLAQAYGYSHGHQRKEKFSVHDAVLFGARHLSHFANLRGRVAWPLTPMLCGPLLLVAVYLPSLRQHPTLVEALVVGTLCATFFGVGSLFWSPDEPRWPLTWWLALHRWPFLQAAVYALLYAGLVFGWWWLKGTRLVGHITNLPPPTNEIVSYMLFGWLLFMAYLGSRFDGALDRVQHVHATDGYSGPKIFGAREPSGKR